MYLLKAAYMVKKPTILNSINSGVKATFDSFAQESGIEIERLSLVIKVLEGKASAIMLKDNEEEIAKEELNKIIHGMASKDQINNMLEALRGDSVNGVLCTILAKRVLCCTCKEAVPKYWELTKEVEEIDLGQFIESILD